MPEFETVVEAEFQPGNWVSENYTDPMLAAGIQAQ
jgi:hypothetical protein